MSRAGLRFWSAVLAFAVFLVDVLTPLEGAVAVLYVVAVLLAAKTTRRDDIIVAAAGCVVLTIAAYLLSHDLNSVASPALRALVSLAAIAEMLSGMSGVPAEVIVGEQPGHRQQDHEESDE